MIHRILLGIGGTPFSSVAVQRAVQVAQETGAGVTAVTVIDENRLGNVGSVPLGAGAAAADLRQHRLQVTRKLIDETLDDLKRRCADHGVSLSIHREQGSPFHLMIDYARYHDVSVFGLRSMFEYDILGDSDVEPAKFLQQLIGGGVRPLIAASERFRTVRRVLVAYSGSVQSAEAMQQFVRFRIWPDAVVRILVCTHPREEAEKMLADAAVYCRAHGCDPETGYRPEDAKQGILAEAAEWNADLLVIGSSMKSWLAAIFQETTMLHLIRKTDCPLFIGN